MGEGTVKPVRVAEGLYEYTTKAGLVRYKASIKHHDKYYRKCGFPTISKARKWRQSRVGAIADGRFVSRTTTQTETRGSRTQGSDHRRLCSNVDGGLSGQGIEAYDLGTLPRHFG